MNLTLIIINTVLLYLEDKNIHKCYTAVIDNLFDAHQILFVSLIERILLS